MATALPKAVREAMGALKSCKCFFQEGGGGCSRVIGRLAKNLLRVSTFLDGWMVAVNL